MKIQIIAHNRKCQPGNVMMRWDRLPLLFQRMGHEVDHVLLKDWKRFYLRYLSFKPDVVISVGVVGSFPAFLKKIGLINAPLVHDWTDDYTDVMGKKHGISKISFMEHFILNNSDYVTTPSRFLQKKCELYGIDAKYVPHGVNKEFFRGKPAELKGKTRVVYVGSQSEYKMTDKIIRAVKDRGCDLYLFGKTNEKMKEKAGGNVHFMGEVKHTEIPRYLRASDILVFAADDDSTLKMFEYIKAGKAILALKGRPGYVLDNNVNALLVDDLGYGLEKLLKDKKLRERLSRNIKKFGVGTWENVAKEYLNLLESIIKR